MRKGTWLWVTIMAALALVLSGPAPSAWAQIGQAAPLPGSAIPQWVNQLPTLAAGGGTMENVVFPATAPSLTTLYMRPFKANILPPLTPTLLPYTGTKVLGYRTSNAPFATNPDTYIGPVFVTSRNLSTGIKYVNNLGATGDPLVPPFWQVSIDQSLHWANPGDAPMMIPGPTPGMMIGNTANYTGPIPAVPHLHGGEVPAALDGGPDAWFLSDAPNPNAYPVHGPGYYSSQVAGDTVNPNEAIYRYPNTMEAAPIWFHDHLLGGTRINVYAGIAGAYLLTDPALTLPAGMNALGLLNGPAGGTELIVPLVLQDRMFTNTGELYFPNLGLNPEHPFWIPEFVGDSIVVNGKAWPNLNVEAKRHSFLLINGSNARFYELSVQAPMYVIGTDGGYLDAPVQVSKLVMGPGERYQVIIDFGKFAGKKITMTNTGRTPFPKGAPPKGSTLGRIVQFTVGPVTSFAGADPSYNPGAVPVVPIRTGAQMIQRLVDPVAGTLNPAVVPNVALYRQLTLNEVMGMGGPLEVLVNNSKWSGTRPTSTTPSEPIPGFTSDGTGNWLSELPVESTTEVWEIINITADAHPIHLHLVQYQILNRQNFNVAQYLKTYNAAFPVGFDFTTGLPTAGGVFVPAYGPPMAYNTNQTPAAIPAKLTIGGNPDITPFLQGAATPPDANEAGWKDTVIMYPGQVTRIAVRFAPMDTAPATVANFPFNPNDTNPAATPGTGVLPNYNYVWHCHIVDHEDNEMMRPYQVIPAAGATRTYIKGTNY